MKMNKLSVSIVVPVYNVEKYFRTCLKSIISQESIHININLVDDGALDRSAEMCDEAAFMDDRIICVHKKNGGLSSARNVGIDISESDYVGFVDSDDFIAPQMYYRMLSTVIKDDSDICICGLLYVDETGEPLVDNTAKVEIENGIISREKAIENLVLKGAIPYVTAVTKLYHRSLFEQCRFLNGKIHEDEFIAHHVLYQCKKVSCINEKYYYYVQRTNSITNSVLSISNIDEVEAQYDRYLFLKRCRFNSLALISIDRAYGMIIPLIRNKELLRNKAITQLTLKIVLALFPDIKSIKLSVMYLIELFKCRAISR